MPIVHKVGSNALQESELVRNASVPVERFLVAEAAGAVDTYSIGCRLVVAGHIDQAIRIVDVMKGLLKLATFVDEHLRHGETTHVLCWNNFCRSSPKFSFGEGSI